jgi:uncharacterized Zn-finger protein
MKPFEVIEVHSLEVACDGGAYPLGHPKVFLHIDHASHQIQCPYCSRLYVMKTDDNRKVS